MLDGDTHFHYTTGLAQALARNSIIPDMLVVGIPNTVRIRDLTPRAVDPRIGEAEPRHGGAAVVGAIHALAARKAKVNAVGVVGLVENLPSATAYKPGDIVTTMSGRTIEVIDTDAEGRMVLVDALYYTATRFKPRCIVDLATLTYAVMAAVGGAYAGIFCNDDRLNRQLIAAGEATGERLWRLPIDGYYDANLESGIADFRHHSPDDESADAAHAAAGFFVRVW